MLAVASVVLTYGLVEAALTALFVRGYVDPVPIWMHERTDPAGNLRFDPVRGARLSATPARIVCIASNGSIETRGRYFGNNQGFPDRDDFHPKRGDPATLRFAVFGDSFSHAQFFDTNWPDRTEDLAREAGRKLELLNFSLDGAGLLNWASVLTRFVEPQGYELDGVIFAVWGNDLDRHFTWWDDRPRKHKGELKRVLLGRSKNFDLDETPDGIVAGSPYVRWYVVTPDQLDHALAGDWRPEVHRAPRAFLWGRAQRLWAELSGGSVTVDRPRAFSAGQRALIERTRLALNGLGLPVLVVRVPNQVEDPSWEGDAERFAELLDADFVDGGAAFEGLSDTEFEALWLATDGHWNQSGSDLFAEFALRAIANWTERLRSRTLAQ
jgi:hypothetical protein